MNRKSYCYIILSIIPLLPYYYPFVLIPLSLHPFIPYLCLTYLCFYSLSLASLIFHPYLSSFNLSYLFPPLKRKKAKRRLRGGKGYEGQVKDKMKERQQEIDKAKRSKKSKDKQRNKKDGVRIRYVKGKRDSEGNKGIGRKDKR